MTVENRFENTLSDIFTVYEHADKESSVLTTEVLPSKFLENDPASILTSLKSYIDGNKNYTKTTILKKYNQGEYTGSPYKLYHDVKIVSSSLISQHKVGTKEYKNIDFFYKFSTEILLREVSRIHLSIFNEHVESTELESHLKQDYTKISNTYSLTNGEVITYVSKPEEPEPTSTPYSNIYANPVHVQPPKQNSIPLFSSLLGKSEVDTNPTYVPDPYSISKVVPNRISLSRACLTFDSLSPALPKFLAGSENSQTEILHDFFHPLWYTIPVPTWLDYKADLIKPPTALPIQNVAVSAPTSSAINEKGTSIKPTLAVLQQRGSGSDPASTVATLIQGPGDSFRSFAPNVDLKDAIVTEELKGKIWLHHLGFAEIDQFRAKYEKKVDVASGVSKSEEEESKLVQKPIDKKEEVKDEDPMEVTDEVTDEINVKNLVQWDPEQIEVLKFLRREKASITESPKALQRLISTLTLKLNKLRQERFLHADAKSQSLPSSEEITTYRKIEKLVTIAIKLYNVSPGDFPYQFSKKLPVLTTEYTGVLPGISQSKIQPMMPSNVNRRLPSIRGPYKKKNRF
ncbi:uncharacterized protein CANTADRAFT_25562 [Suhomyces tanzawaensis NRRL Y-17324]|uniref:Chromatin structure-remodeling complex protein RSC58 n=1 Tax=Suhomyces tanzawaensis NRRL Y-17324 TaxID=984487 RepID=A0A1E4SJF7_9ASCO|nr:uncharacterized protein CANTADRAFT_25562 [Suhomyces tanzawaensis NRRL Y-17324]ODV79639.1 hypothetical protein CANTADRAFT_25562 [Suhomyces tanzawaensis NRRL Y-17324]